MWLVDEEAAAVCHVEGQVAAVCPVEGQVAASSVAAVLGNTIQQAAELESVPQLASAIVPVEVRLHRLPYWNHSPWLADYTESNVGTYLEFSRRVDTFLRLLGLY